VSGCGYHRTPRTGSNAGGGWKIALVLLAAALLATPAEAAVTAALHVLEVVLVVLACLAGGAAALGLAAVAVRVRRRYPARAQDAALVAGREAPQVPSWPHHPALTAPRRAIEAPKVIPAEGRGRSAR
jgi:acetyl-CoA carboxylase carboxyltransferase component